MQKKLWIVMALLLVVPMMFLTVSCQQQVVKDGSGDGDGTGTGTGPLTPEQIKEKELAEQFQNEDVLYAYDSSSLDATAQSVLRAKAEYLKERQGAAVLIEGHCDERGTNEYNLALGERRAASAKAFLVDLGIDGARLSTTSYGEERPMDTGHDEAAWAKNRRAHFVLK